MLSHSFNACVYLSVACETSQDNYQSKHRTLLSFCVPTTDYDQHRFNSLGYLKRKSARKISLLEPLIVFGEWYWELRMHCQTIWYWFKLKREFFLFDNMCSGFHFVFSFIVCIWHILYAFAGDIQILQWKQMYLEKGCKWLFKESPSVCLNGSFNVNGVKNWGWK